MNDSESQPSPRPTGRFQYRLRTVFLVFFAVAVLLGFWSLLQRQRLADIESLRLWATCPIALHVVCHDGPASIAPEFHQGTATYTFRNKLPMKIKIAFPPISRAYDCGQVPFAKGVSRGFPDFCRKPRLVELPPYGEVHFEAAYGFIGKTPPRELWMFGNPAASQDEGLVLTPVYSTTEWGPPAISQAAAKK